MTTEQIQSSPLAQSVQLMREHLIKTDGNGYCCFLDELHACNTVCDLQSLLLNTLASRFQYDVLDLLPPSEGKDKYIQDREDSLETLHRCSYFSPETFNAQFKETLLYALRNIHPETL